MGRRAQVSKGYTKHLGKNRKMRWNAFLRTERRLQKAEKGKGRDHMANQLETELAELSSDLQLEKKATARYKQAWEAEKTICQTLRNERDELRKTEKELRTEIIAARVCLAITALMGIWAISL